jgi:phosphopantetheine--protein transferase-like protein
MIYGIGTDIIEINRIKKVIEKYPKLMDRLFSAEELEYYEYKHWNPQNVAGGFSAKEAVFKAIGTGLSKFKWKGLLKRAILPVTDPNKPELMIPIEIKFIKRPRIKIKFKDNEPIIDIDLKIEGDILAIQSRIDYESPKLTPIVEKAVEEYIKREVDETVKKCRDELRADIFEFGNIAAMRFPTIQKWEEYSWNEHFENAIINTTVKFKIKRTGTMISDSPIITSEGKEIK